MIIKRTIIKHLEKMLTQFPVISVTGPRQAGKTTMLRDAFKDYKYYNLERMDHRQLIIEDPIAFLKNNGPRVIFDEAQNLPELFSYIQVISDERNVPGQYILSGSQSFLMNEKISQSLAGRVFVGHLLPFSMHELNKKQDIYTAIYNGYYPRLHESGINAADFYPSYLQTYIERDIRSLKAVSDLNSFSRFVGLCAGRIGQVLNLTSLANDAGIAVNTAKAWISLLEASFIVYQLQPYYRNFNKRIIKSPKLYFYDTGLACSLLRINSQDVLKTHYLYGALFENLVISEIIKQFHHSGIRPPVYYWRESNGIEIDCIIEKNDREIAAVEIKAGQTFNKDYLKNIKKLPETGLKVEKRIIYTGTENTEVSGVYLMNWELLGEEGQI